jgi:hypothetical protein
MVIEKTTDKIVKILLKEVATRHTVTSIAAAINASRVGAWKALKKMQAEKTIELYPLGESKTSAYTINLNWDNPIVEKRLAVALTEEALDNQRWMLNLKEIADNTDFLVLYGSIIKRPKEANDIDIIAVTSDKKSFLRIDNAVKNAQRIQTKKIHLISFTHAELKIEIARKNPAIIDAIKNCVVLKGQENFIKSIKEAST